jgi:PAS domain S-box-containing protein
MQPADRLPDEERRLAVLRAYRVLDTPTEAAFDRIAALAAAVCETPSAMISFVDEERQWFKARVGVDVAETPRDVSFCGHAIQGDDLFVVPDTHQDQRFADNPLVTGPLNVGFYAGAPIVTADGHRLGALCVTDRVPRELTAAQRAALETLSHQVVAELELRRLSRELVEAETRLRLVADNSPVGTAIVDRAHRFRYVNPAYVQLCGLTSEALLGHSIGELFPEGYDERVRPSLERAFAGEHVTYEHIRQVQEQPQYLDVSYEPASAHDGFVVVKVTDVTHTQAAAIGASRLAAIVESSGDAIVGKTLDGIVTSWNRGAEAIFGYSAEEMIGTSIARIIPRDRLGEEADILRSVRQGEAVRHLETRRLTRDGRTIDVSLSSSPIRDSAGRVVGASKVARDVTEAKRAEMLLREREAVLRIYAEHSPVAVAMFDTRMRYLVASRRWIEDYRLENTPLIGRSHYEIFPNLPVRWRGIHTRALRGEVMQCEEDAFEYDGRVDWLRWEVRPWHHADGVIGGIIIFVEDIGPRKQAERALRENIERTAFALESAGVGTWDVDFATQTVRMSTVAEMQFGYEPGTFPGTFEAFMDRVHPEDREHVERSVIDVGPRGGDFQISYRVVRPDQSVRWLSGSGRATNDQAGQPQRVAGVSIDVTERRNLEAQYQQAQKMEAVGRLAGGVAHDFNNLLTAILGSCDMLMDDLPPADERRHDVEEIQRAGQSAAGLTRQLLAFSRKQIIRPTALDLNVVVSEMRRLLERMIGEDIRVTMRLAPGELRFMGDRGQMEQLIANLAVNARDAMPRGGSLTIETQSVTLDEHYAERHFSVTPGAYVSLVVTDTGVGIPADVLTHIFEPFFTTKEAGKGTGLGLATVHGVVSRLGGSVSVYSEVGIGTSFKVYLPAAAPEAEAEAQAEAARPAVSTGGETILVVEDAAGLRSLSQRILRRRGYRVLAAANAVEAEQIFAAHPEIALVLSDVVMPGASGTELAERLRQQRPDVKVVFMSGYTEDAIVQHGVLKTGVDFLHKPFTADILGAKVREVLDR